MDRIEYVKPSEIEKQSFAIIDENLKAMGIVLPKESAMITKRCIHTSADFDYASTLEFSKNAPGICAKLIRKGATIVTDTQMALSGINKKKLEKYGSRVLCFMSDESIAKKAGEIGVTRAYLSMKEAMKIKGEKIFVVGNAPTALISLYEMVKEDKYPDFIIGVPVGFVNVVASKELFLGGDIPYIINRGNKGGSNIAAAIVNAICYEMDKGAL